MINVIESKEIKVNGVNILPLAEIKSGSDITLNLELYKNNIPFDVAGQEISLAAVREDKIVIEQVSGINATSNKITIKLKNNILEVAGVVLCELIITDSIGTTVTSNFKLKVNQSILTVDAISANDIETIGNIKKAEISREQKEKTREQNEAARKNVEVQRVSEESERQRNEKNRVSSEQTRVSQEAQRQNSENTRVSQEAQRVSKESERKSAETSRASDFNSLKNQANILINKMNEIVSGDKVNNLEKEIIKARSGNLQLSDRLNAIDGVNNSQNSKISSLESVNNSQNSRLSAIENVNQSQQRQIDRKLEEVNWWGVNDKPSTFPPIPTQETPLWEGAIYMTNSQTINPSKALSNCRSGWVLVFCKYQSGAAQDWGYTFHFVNKQSVRNGTKGTTFLMCNDFYDGINNFNDIRTKYLYIRNESISGHERNNRYGNEDFALRYIYEF